MAFTPRALTFSHSFPPLAVGLAQEWLLHLTFSLVSASPLLFPPVLVLHLVSPQSLFSGLFLRLTRYFFFVLLVTLVLLGFELSAACPFTNTKS